MSGSKWAATPNARRTYIPLLYLFTGVSKNFSTPEKSTISSNLALISDRVIPKIAPFKKIFSLPVNSGWNPVPTSNKEAIRPISLMVPELGAVILLIILSRVLFPAPFRPIIPKTSPAFTVKEISSNAIMSDSSSVFLFDKTLESKSFLKVLAETEPNLYLFETPRTSIAVCPKLLIPCP